MEGPPGPGSEVSKRPRLGSYDPSSHLHRMQPQLSTSQSHGYGTGHTLPPPNTQSAQAAPFVHHSPGGAPASYHHDAASHDYTRQLPAPEPTPHSYVQAHSGHSTPIREQRPFPSDANYSRRGSASGPTRSPDDYQYGPPRQLSIATSNESQRYPSQQYTVDPGGQANYHSLDGPVNGNGHHGLPTQNNSEQPYPSHSAHTNEYSHSPLSAHPHAYSTHAPYQAMPLKTMSTRKGTRATQACDACRTRKSKCDERRPMCGNCREQNQTCIYQQMAPAKADRANQTIIDSLAAISKRLDGMDGKFDGMDRRLGRMEKAVGSRQGHSPETHQSQHIEDTDIKAVPLYQPLPPKMESPAIKPNAEKPVQSFVKPHKPGIKGHEGIETSPSVSLATTSTDSTSMNVPFSESGPSVSIEHATAAHRLLHWPSIHTIVNKSAPIRMLSVQPDYVMQMEEAKGVLRVYGRGQGRESTIDSYGSPPSASQQGSNSPSSSTSTKNEDPASPASSPPEGLWGSGSVPATNNEKPASTVAGGITSVNSLDIHPRTMRGLLNSYLENFHILHPFLEKSRLTRMFERFSMRYNKSDQVLSKALFAGPASNAALDALRDGSSGLPKAAKRKYSSGHYSTSSESNTTPTLPNPEIRLEHNISTAIVLLVMALGKIADHKEQLPGPVHVPGDRQEMQNALRQSPARMHANSRSPPPSVEQSPKSSNYAGTNPSIHSLLSGPRTDTSSPRPLPDDISNLPLNVDVIPGLAYYAKATDILGNLHGLNDLTHVQAHLLAGLFAGQLARTFESWSWIHSACIACRFIVREANMTHQPDSRKDLIKFAFWTCSQLESDILAELDLPRSGIQDITLNYPKGFMDDFEKADMTDVTNLNETVMWYYSGQIHIRNMLNDIQSELYPPADKERAVRGTALRDHFHDRLKAWRDLLPAGLQWQDSDEPSSDINTARLRAKYYGAQYIIHRPFLRHALDNNMAFQDSASPAIANPQVRSSSFSPQAMERSQSAMGPPEQTEKQRLLQGQILQSAKICVAAAIQSTEAFDNIINKQRLIVTNIFGTAHAQFGNMLVLATTYKSRLSFLIPRYKLEHLFSRTIKFLQSLQPISETLAKDALILDKLRDVVFDEGNLGHSFSSDMS